MSQITDSQRIEILFNKSVGKATTVPGAQLGQLPGENANPKVIPALQVYSQYIPPIAPDESDLIDDPNFNSEDALQNLRPAHQSHHSPVRQLYVRDGIVGRIHGS